MPLEICVFLMHNMNGLECLKRSATEDFVCKILLKNEGLAEYNHAHNESFEGLDIGPENIERLAGIANWAADYYKWGS